MKLRLTKPVVIQGYPGIKVGDTFDTDNPNEYAGYVEEVKESEKKYALKPVSDPFAVETREPEVEVRDPKPRKFKKTLP